MRTVLIPALALFATVAAIAAPTANATDFCNGEGQVVDVGGQAYLTLDAILSHGYLFSIWLYAEANGEPDLQRGGVTLLGDADVCQDSPNPDLGIF